MLKKACNILSAFIFLFNFFQLNGQTQIAAYPATFTGKAKPVMLKQGNGEFIFLVDNRSSFQMIQLNAEFEFLKGNSVKKEAANIPLEPPIKIYDYTDYLDLFYDGRTERKVVRIRLNKAKRKPLRFVFNVPEIADFQIFGKIASSEAYHVFQVNRKTQELVIHSYKDEASPTTFRFQFPETLLLADEFNLRPALMDELPEVLIQNNASKQKIYFQEDQFVLTFNYDKALKTRTLFLDKKTGEISSTDHWMGSVEKDQKYATNSLMFDNTLFQVKAADNKLSISATNLASRHLIKEWEFNDHEEIWDLFAEVKKEIFSFENSVFESNIKVLDQFSNTVSMGIRRINNGKMQLVIGSYQPKNLEDLFYSAATPRSSSESAKLFKFFPTNEVFEAEEGDAFFMSIMEIPIDDFTQLTSDLTPKPLDRIKRYLKKQYLQLESKAQMIFHDENNWYLGYLKEGEYVILRF